MLTADQRLVRQLCDELEKAQKFILASGAEWCPRCQDWIPAGEGLSFDDEVTLHDICYAKVVQEEREREAIVARPRVEAEEGDDDIPF